MIRCVCFFWAPSRGLPEHRHPCWFPTLSAWSIETVMCSAAAFVWISRHILPTTGGCQPDLLRMSKHETFQSPAFKWWSPYWDFFSCFSSSYPSKSLLSSQRPAARWWLTSDANTQCSIIITVAIRANVSHMFTGAMSQVSAGINAESAHDGQKPSAKESFPILQAHGEKGQTVTMETLSCDWPTGLWVSQKHSVSGELLEVKLAL